MTDFAPVYFVPTRQDLAALTFDDGPTPGVTDKILQFLSTKYMKATFFMIGEQVQKYPSLAKEVVAAGHDVAVHSQRHKRGMKDWEYSAILDDFKRAKDNIETATGVIPTMIRAPFGNICPNIAAACQELDLSYIGWSVATKDWFGDAKDKAWRLRFCTRGSIVLFHDGGRVNPDNVSRTIGMIDSLSKLNYGQYQLTSVSRLLKTWDDALCTSAGDCIAIGWNPVIVPGQEFHIVVYWHPSQIAKGISYGVEFNRLKYSVDIPPMSNVDEWLKPVVVPDYDGASLCSLLWDGVQSFSSLYNGA